MIRLPIRCIYCNTMHDVYVKTDDYDKFRHGEGYVQTLFPYLSAGKRELLISQTCESCFDDMFKETVP